MYSHQKYVLSAIAMFALFHLTLAPLFAENENIEQVFENSSYCQPWISCEESGSLFTQQNRTAFYQPMKLRRTLFSWSTNNINERTDLDTPLVTDRPDFTEASSTVGLGIAQIEFGYTYTSNSDNRISVRTQSLGELLLRYGIINDWLELRVGLSPIEEETVGLGASNRTLGTEDLYLGLKIALTSQEGWKPEMAIIPQMTLPTGSGNFSDNETLLGVNWIYSWEINDTISTAGSTQFNRAIDQFSGDSYFKWAQSWTISYTLTERLGAYTEWYAFFPNSAETEKTEHYTNGGFTYLINNDIQFDIRAGYGLNNAADDYFIGTGLSIRFQ